MRPLAFFPALFLASAYALPQNSCSTVTTEIIVPSTTATYTSTPVVTEHPSTAEDLSTFTLVTTLSSTKTLETLISTSTACISTATVTNPVLVTVYTDASTTSTSVDPPSPPGYVKRAIGIKARYNTCTVTSTHTTTYGQTETYVLGSQTSTFYDYTAFTQATVTSTKYGGTAYVIATATATTSQACGSTTMSDTQMTSTVSQDQRCAPTAMTSAYSGFGLEYQDDVPIGGAVYMTSTHDAPSCCQLCVEASNCAASSWDIRSGQCRLEFPVDPTSGNMNCGEGLLAFYDYGPDHPMSPGTGLYVAALCGNIEFAGAPPDDGT